MDQESSVGSARFGSSGRFNGVKVFSATLMQDREGLGELITQWIQKHPQYEINEIVVTQSSDAAFHCLAMTVFYFDTTEA